MNPLDFPLLPDENISPELVAALRERRREVCTTHEIGLAGASAAILTRAMADNRVVLTHDSDFGLLAVRQGVAFFGIIFLRPGHIRTSFHLEALDTLHRAPVDVNPPFLLVVEHRQERVLIRLRQEP